LITEIHSITGVSNDDDNLFIAALVALFALPKVYECNENVIDQYVDLAWAKISEINSK
jgi:hypothetical protein